MLANMILGDELVLYKAMAVSRSVPPEASYQDLLRCAAAQKMGLRDHALSTTGFRKVSRLCWRAGGGSVTRLALSWLGAFRCLSIIEPALVAD